MTRPLETISGRRFRGALVPVAAPSASLLAVFARALLLLITTVLACLPQWSLPDWHGTEGRRVQIALEMVRAGDWMVPTLGGQPTWAKPPLHYWTLGGLIQWFDPNGENLWLLRAPAVLALFAASWLAMELMRRWFSERAGWVAALGIQFAPVVLAEWASAEIDPLFSALTAMSVWCLATGIARDRRGLVLWSGLLGGLAMLQKGPPYFMLTAGAYLVWWRRRGLRHALLHFVPLFVVPLCYFVPLWCLHVAPAEMFSVVNDETVGRVAGFHWSSVAEIPEYWLRAFTMLLPLVLWCFWEWRGARDARMDAADLTLRMCSGAAVLAVVVLTFFPGRATRYLLPNVLLFTFAVAPAVAHFAGQERALGSFSTRVLRWLGVLGAAALVAIPFVGRGVGVAAAGAALCAALGPLLVRTPSHLVVFCLVLPLVGEWTVGLDRARGWPDTGRARRTAGQVLKTELDALGATEVVTQGHIDAPLVLGAGLLPRGDESSRTVPTARWLLHESADRPPRLPAEYVERLRLCMPGQTFAVRERVPGPPR